MRTWSPVVVALAALLISVEAAADGEHEYWRVDERLIAGGQVTTGAIETVTIDAAIDMVGGWRLAEDSAWMFDFGIHVRRRTDVLIGGEEAVQGLIRLETGPQVWLGEKLWFRPTIGVAYGGYQHPDDHYVWQPGDPPDHFFAATASLMVGVTLLSSLHEQSGWRTNISALVRVGNTFGGGVQQEYRRRYVLVGVGFYVW